MSRCHRRTNMASTPASARGSESESHGVRRCPAASDKTVTPGSRKTRGPRHGHKILRICRFLLALSRGLVAHLMDRSLRPAIFAVFVGALVCLSYPEVAFGAKSFV